MGRSEQYWPIKTIIEKFKLIGAKRPLGMLLYVALGSRPDIAWIVNTLARYVTTDYGIEYINAILKIVKYLKTTESLTLRIGGVYTNKYGKIVDTSKEGLLAYTDADYGNDVNSR